MVIVEREVGGKKQYAVRRGRIFKSYLSARGRDFFWWFDKVYIEEFAWSSSFEETKLRFDRLNSLERIIHP